MATADRSHRLAAAVPVAPAITTDNAAALDGWTSNSLIRLQTWLSPSFPTGGFAYSHGLETAAVERRVNNSADLGAWLSDLLASGSLWCDAVLLVAAAGAPGCASRDVADLAEALAPSRERHLETMAQGTAFLRAVTAGWPDVGTAAVAALGPSAAYPVAVGATLALGGIPTAEGLAAYLNAVVTGLIGAAMRLVPLGHEGGLRTLSALQPLILATAERAAHSTLDDLGSAAILSDIQSMRHEQLYSRIFRS